MVAHTSNVEMANLFLDLAKTYHNHAADLFKLFISVLLGTVAFASGFPPKTSSNIKKIGKFYVSTHSLAIASVLLSFYVICFLSFRSAIVNAQKAAGQFLLFHKESEGFEVLDQILGFNGLDELTIVMPQVGFILGSTMGVFVFLFLTNTKVKGK